MVINLANADVNHVGYTGTDDFNIPAGSRLRIETSPGGDEYLDVQVPEGKEWRVQINIEITESDA